MGLLKGPQAGRRLKGPKVPGPGLRTGPENTSPGFTTFLLTMTWTVTFFLVRKARMRGRQFLDRHFEAGIG